MYRTCLKQLSEWKAKKNRKPLVLQGARQVGKTYALKQFGQESFDQYHYFNFEADPGLADFFSAKLEPRFLIEQLSLYSQKKISATEDLIIFDEIQNCPRALSSLKYFNEELPEAYVCAAGSLLGLNIEEASFPVGKIEFLQVLPMSFEEYLLGVGDDRCYEIAFTQDLNTKQPEALHALAWEQLKRYFIIGGLPASILVYKKAKEEGLQDHEAFNLVRQEQEDLINTYLGDIAKHCGKINAMHIQRLLSNIPSQLAREADGSASKFKLRGQIPGIKGFAQIAGALDWLDKAGLIIKVPIVNSAQLPLSAYAAENKFKLFMLDVGLLGAIAALEPAVIWDYKYGTYKGYFAENFVAQELACAQGDRKHIYAWNEGTAEIEFLRTCGSKLSAIEVKSGHVTQSKSLRVFGQKYKPDREIILSANTFSYNPERNLYRYPLYLTARI